VQQSIVDTTFQEGTTLFGRVPQERLQHDRNPLPPILRAAIACCIDAGQARELLPKTSLVKRLNGVHVPARSSAPAEDSMRLLDTGDSYSISAPSVFFGSFHRTSWYSSAHSCIKRTRVGTTRYRMNSGLSALPR
jgi:hypothetical protein